MNEKASRSSGRISASGKSAMKIHRLTVAAPTTRTCTCAVTRRKAQPRRAHLILSANGAGKAPERDDPIIAQQFYCWVCNPQKTSPAGTTELTPLLLPSLRDLTVFRQGPALKRWAIIARP